MTEAEIGLPYLDAREEAALRDQFAMSALQGVIAGEWGVKEGVEESLEGALSRGAYVFADAMMKARVKK